jgi:hypothetical protein
MTRRTLAAVALGAALTLAAPTTTPAPDPVRWYSGKPAGTITLPTDCRWRTVLTEPATTPTGGTELRMLYLRLKLPKATGPRTIGARFIRTGGDATAYTVNHHPARAASVPLTALHFDTPRHAGGTWQARACGPGRPVTVSTRYAKLHTV